jgi:hypothetical protein
MSITTGGKTYFNDKVGVLNNNPTADLDVTGTLRISNLLNQTLSDPATTASYVKIGAVIIQWGRTGNIATNATLAITLATSFTSSTSYCVTVTSNYAVASANNTFSATTFTASGFTIYSNNANNISCHWMAIGF